MRRVGDPAGGEAPRVADAGSRSIRLVGWARSSPCIVNTQQAVAERRVAHRGAVVRARAVDERLLHGLAGAAVLDEPAPDPGQARRPGRRRRCASSPTMWSSWAPVTAPAPHRRAAGSGKPPTDSVWKWYMRFRPTWPDELARPLAQQQPRRLEGAGGQDHVGGADLVRRRRSRVEVADARWPGGRDRSRVMSVT